MHRTPAEKLEGYDLPCGWHVSAYIPTDVGHTGGAFSIGYLVEKDGVKGFLKALDFKKLMAMGAPDPLSAIRYMTESFEYERDILRECRTEGLSKVIRSLSDGSIDIDGFPVPYIVFEMATGDVRKESTKQAGFELAWVLRTMHHICVGLKQLHSRNISHQDLKPSNVLVVNDGERKIGDFGTCVTQNCKLPHANTVIAGDRTYASPEGLYGFTHSDWSMYRYGIDAYQAGSLFVFMITGVPASTILMSNVHDSYRPGNWNGTYEQVIQYLDEAFIKVINTVSAHLNEKLNSEIITIVRELCEPSIFLRGDPVLRRRKQNPFGMERYVSRFNRLATIAERELYNMVKS